MARFRSNKVVIDSVKHEVKLSALLASGGSIKSVPIATAKNIVAVDDDVKTGSVIKAIFFEINFNFESNITAIVEWALIKRKSGQTATDYDPGIPNLPTRSGKFLWGMEMPAGINNSSAVKRIGTLLIPKGKQRMSEGDVWDFVYRSTAGAGQEDVCAHFIYKEYR